MLTMMMRRVRKSTLSVRVLTEMRSWNSEVGTMGMAPPCFPNFLSRLSWTDTAEKTERQNRKVLGTSGRRVRLTQQVVVGFPLVFEGESTVTDVIQILQPLEVRDGDAAGVQIHVLSRERRR